MPSPSRPSVSPPFELAGTPRTYTCELTPPAQTGPVNPRNYTEQGAVAEVTHFRLEILPPQE